MMRAALALAFAVATLSATCIAAWELANVSPLPFGLMLAWSGMHAIAGKDWVS